MWVVPLTCDTCWYCSALFNSEITMAMAANMGKNSFDWVMVGLHVEYTIYLCQQVTDFHLFIHAEQNVTILNSCVHIEDLESMLWLINSYLWRSQYESHAWKRRLPLLGCTLGSHLLFACRTGASGIKPWFAFTQVSSSAANFWWFHRHYLLLASFF